MVNALTDVENKVFGISLTSESQTLLGQIIVKLKEATIGELAVGSGVGLHVFYSLGATDLGALPIISITIQEACLTVLKESLMYTLPLVIASIISEAYIQPSANAIFNAWTYEQLLEPSTNNFLKTQQD